MINWIIRFYIYAIRKTKWGPLIALGILLLGIIGNTLAFKYFDNQNLGDSVWYSYISVTTIGYGDFSATSSGARWCNFIFIGLVGLGSCSYLIGWTIDKIATTAAKRRKGMSTAIAKNHVIIVNFPNELRVRQIIEEVRADDEHADIEFVIVSNDIDELPFDITGVEFVKGSVIEENTFEQAKIKEAWAAFILATDYNDGTSDALVSTTVGVIEHMCPKVITVAECLQRKHINMFSHLGCDSVVCANEISTNLMVQELQDHGVTNVFNTITSNIKTKGDTLFSATVGKLNDSYSYNDLAHALVDMDGNLISVEKKNGHKLHTNFSKDLFFEQGDVIVFTAERRYRTEELISFAKGYKNENANK